MKINKFFFLLVCLLQLLFISNNDTYAQLANSNMTLHANRNTHPPVGGDLYSAIWGYRAPNGREYAILGCANGTAFFEVTDTTNIVERDFIPGSNNSWREMKVYSHYAYIVSELTGSALLIVDLQYLPDSVHVVRTWNFTGYSRTHTISQEGPYLYLNGGNASTGGGVRVVDLTSNPELPVQRGQWTTEYIHDCRVLRDTIWGANIYDASGGGTGSIYVISAVNKDVLTTINSWVNAPNPGPHNIAITPDRRYALVTDEIPTTTPRVLKIWNIQNLSNVTFVAQWQPTGIPTNPGSVVHNVEIYGNYALIAHYSAGVRLVNISNPAAPTEVAWYDTYPSNNNQSYNGCWGVFMLPSGKIIASDRQTGLYVLRTSVPITGINDPVNTPQSFTLKQNYPNPFNPSTTIEYSISKASYVTIKVYDVLGRQVALLVDEYKQAGNQMVTFDAARLASGVYYYTLATDNDFTETKKMILNK